MNNNSFRIKSLIGEEATCWPISSYRLSVLWESGVHEFWNPKDLEDMIAHYGWEKLEDSVPQITSIKECSANAYTASLWQISDHFYTLQWDHWVESMTYCKEDVEDNFAKGIWTKVEDIASESLPRSFKYYFHNNPQRIYTAQPCGDKLLQVDWEDDYCGGGFQYNIEDARRYIAEGSWVIIPSVPEKKPVSNFMSPEIFADKFEDILQRQSEDAIYISRPSARGYSRDPDYSIGEDADKLIAEYTKAVEYKSGDKFTMGDYIFEIYGKNSKVFLDVEQALKDRMKEDVLQYIKSFTEDSGHEVWIAEGTYKVYRMGEDCPYICYTDKQVVAVMEALLMLDSVETEG